MIDFLPTEGNIIPYKSSNVLYVFQTIANCSGSGDEEAFVSTAACISNISRIVKIIMEG